MIFTQKPEGLKWPFLLASKWPLSDINPPPPRWVGGAPKFVKIRILESGTGPRGGAINGDTADGAKPFAHEDSAGNRSIELLHALARRSWKLPWSGGTVVNQLQLYKVYDNSMETKFLAQLQLST